MMNVAVRIIPYDPQYAKAFADLNYEWIAENYGVEQHDREQLDDPKGSVIDPGGQIFFALVGHEVAGTVAMIRMDDDYFELAKMAVPPKFQGRKIGELLMNACIDFARSKRSVGIILESNTRQVAAISLYLKHGFVDIPLDPKSQFARANIRMQLALSADEPVKS